MKIELYIIPLFCYCMFTQASFEQETRFDMQRARARLQREQSKQFYKENQWLKQAAIQRLKQAAIQRKIERVQKKEQDQEIKVAVAEVYEIPVAVVINDSYNGVRN